MPEQSYADGERLGKRPRDAAFANNTPPSKRRRALQDVGANDARLNHSDPCYAKPSITCALNESALIGGKVSEPKYLDTSPLNLQKRRESHQSNLRSENERKEKSSNSSWPKMLDHETFERGSISEQRIVLRAYEKELVEYIDLIQAGAVPTYRVMKLLNRMNTHIATLDAARDKVQMLLEERTQRRTQIIKLMHEEESNDREIIELIDAMEPTKEIDDIV